MSDGATKDGWTDSVTKRGLDSTLRDVGMRREPASKTTAKNCTFFPFCFETSAGVLILNGFVMQASSMPLVAISGARSPRTRRFKYYGTVQCCR
jgi:hypothetical protein